MATSPEPPDRRRVLAAIVTGLAGDAIQAWREVHDPHQAHRLPPHATLCYGIPHCEAEIVEAQIWHAFAQPIAVRLGGVHEFNNHDGTFYVEVGETQELDAARERLYDGRYSTLPGRSGFTWHITCVRYPKNAERDALRIAARELEASIAAHLDNRHDRLTPASGRHLFPRRHLEHLAASLTYDSDSRSVIQSSLNRSNRGTPVSMEYTLNCHPEWCVRDDVSHAAPLA